MVGKSFDWDLWDQRGVKDLGSLHATLDGVIKQAANVWWFYKDFPCNSALCGLVMTPVSGDYLQRPLEMVLVVWGPCKRKNRGKNYTTCEDRFVANVDRNKIANVDSFYLDPRLNKCTLVYDIKKIYNINRHETGQFGLCKICNFHRSKGSKSIKYRFSTLKLHNSDLGYLRKKAHPRRASWFWQRLKNFLHGWVCQGRFTDSQCQMCLLGQKSL